MQLAADRRRNYWLALWYPLMVGGEYTPLRTHFWQNNIITKNTKLDKTKHTAALLMFELVGMHTCIFIR